MPKMFRILDYANENEWREAASNKYKRDDIPATLLKDWCDNNLSLWMIEGDSKYQILHGYIYENELQRYDDRVTILIFDKELLDNEKIKSKQEDCKFLVNNMKKYHYIIKGFNSGKLLDLIINFIDNLGINGNDVETIKINKIFDYICGNTNNNTSQIIQSDRKDADLSDSNIPTKYPKIIKINVTSSSALQETKENDDADTGESKT